MVERKVMITQVKIIAVGLRGGVLTHVVSRGIVSVSAWKVRFTSDQAETKEHIVLLLP